jgi:hypothetical protein
MSETSPRCEDHSGCIARIDNLEDSNVEIWKDLNSLRNRPPVWCTVIISLLTFGMGFIVALKVNG